MILHPYSLAMCLECHYSNIWTHMPAFMHTHERDIQTMPARPLHTSDGIRIYRYVQCTSTHQLRCLWVGVVILEASGHLCACGACGNRTQGRSSEYFETTTSINCVSLLQGCSNRSSALPTCREPAAAVAAAAAAMGSAALSPPPWSQDSPSASVTHAKAARAMKASAVDIARDMASDHRRQERWDCDLVG